MRLNNTAVKSLSKKPGRHGDGGGLYLCVLEGGAAFWSYRYRSNGQEREMSVGRYPERSLAAARAKHMELRKRVLIDKGIQHARSIKARACQRSAKRPTPISPRTSDRGATTSTAGSGGRRSPTTVRRSETCRSTRSTPRLCSPGRR
jgi:hypothetical protein